MFTKSTVTPFSNNQPSHSKIISGLTMKNHSTRSNKKLHRPCIKTNLRKLSISLKELTDIYNNLPSDLKHIKCKSTFKRKLKNHILTNSLRKYILQSINTNVPYTRICRLPRLPVQDCITELHCSM